MISILWERFHFISMLFLCFVLPSLNEISKNLFKVSDIQTNFKEVLARQWLIKSFLEEDEGDQELSDFNLFAELM